MGVGQDCRIVDNPKLEPNLTAYKGVPVCKSAQLRENLGQFWEIYGLGEKFTGMGGKSVAANSTTNGSCPRKE